ncbi:hypothetical protein [Flavobacterium sp.]|uniref:hypothetical protein n=1 Tax=Flavobacterium sp. TaxID=239 RepID=UPI003D09DE8E
MEQKILYYFDYSKSNRLFATAKATMQHVFKDRSVAKLTPYLASIINDLQQQVVAYAKPVITSRSDFNPQQNKIENIGELNPAEKLQQFNQQALVDFEKLLVVGFPVYENNVSSVQEQESEAFESETDTVLFENKYIAEQADFVKVKESISFLDKRQIDFLHCCLGEGYCASIEENVLKELVSQIKGIASGTTDGSFFELFENFRAQMTLREQMDFENEKFAA